jgi:hypothetical protein
MLLTWSVEVAVAVACRDVVSDDQMVLPLDLKT